MPEVIYSEKEFNEERRIRKVLEGSLHHIEVVSSGDSKRRTGEKSPRYPFIPLGIDEFIFILKSMMDYHKVLREREGVEKIKPLYSLRFLEVGCGIGIKMIIAANMLGMSSSYVHGIEIDKKLIKTAKTLCGNYFNFFEEDALTFQDYGKYDIIYYYCPIRDPGLEVQMEQLIEEQMNSGAYLVYAMKKDKTAWDEAEVWERVSGSSGWGIMRKK